MAELELVESRVISGKGVLRYSADKRESRLYILYTDVVRRPTNPYINRNYNPPRGRYATITFIRNEYVLYDAAVEYPRQVFDGVNDICGQSLLAIKCMYVGILQTFVNLGNALGTPAISVENTIDEYENLRLSWDEIRIVAYADTAIQCRLYRMKYDVCDNAFDDDFNPPPPPPPIAEIPPGTGSYLISPPYNPANNDNNNTQPAPIDSGLPLTSCVINYTYNQFSPVTTLPRTATVSNVRPPIVISAPIYSNNGSDPPGTPRKSEIDVTDSRGVTQRIVLINNLVSGHSVSNFSSPCIF